VAKRLRAQATTKFGKRKTSVPKLTRINWDNQSSDKCTILEVRTGDRLGLAYRIASTLAAFELDIAFAKVATEKHLALDVFYVTDQAGQKLREDELPALESAIRVALAEPSKAEV
jgi:[protein-PII] uridylyltransferase